MAVAQYLVTQGMDNEKRCSLGGDTIYYLVRVHTPASTEHCHHLPPSVTTTPTPFCAMLRVQTDLCSDHSISGVVRCLLGQGTYNVNHTRRRGIHCRSGEIHTRTYHGFPPHRKIASGHPRSVACACGGCALPCGQWMTSDAHW